MTQIFDEYGAATPVTIIQAGPCYVTQIKTERTDGYTAVQLGFGEAKEKSLTKGEKGHLGLLKKDEKHPRRKKNHGIPVLRYLREFRTQKSEEFQLGQKLTVSQFEAGARVDISGNSKGRGFAGVVKRYGCGGGTKTPGKSDRHRAVGSSGAICCTSHGCKGQKIARRTATGRAAMIVTTLMILVVLGIGLLYLSQINPNNYSGLPWQNIFLPYGVILFAFVGTAAIPELREELEKEKYKMKKAIFIGSSLPIIIYLFFTLIVCGLSGVTNFNALAPNERIATVALSLYTSPYLGLAANIFAAFAMFTSFIGLGYALKGMFEFDYHFKNLWAFFLTIVPPLIIAFSNLTNFIAVIGFTGAIAGGVDGILIMLAYWKAKRFGQRQPEYTLRVGKILTTILIIIFTGGIIYQLWHTFL